MQSTLKPTRVSARPSHRLLTLGALSLLGYATVWACSPSSEAPPTTVTPPTPTIAISNSASLSGQQGTTQTSTITLTRGGNYTGAVSLAASGAPAGVTVTLTPTTLSGTTITSTLSAVIGGTATPTTTGSITVTATGSGVSSATATVPITVTAAPSPDFTLSPATANATVVQGQASAATAFTLARLNSYAGDVVLSASGLPTGVTAAFTQPGTGSAGSVVFTALSTAGTGTYPITITASGPNTTAKTATVSLVVQSTPTVVLGLTPPTLSLAQGANGTTSITITRTNITGDVTLTAENVPQGVTATFTPAATSGTTSSLALAVGGSVTPGVYTITVRGTATGATAGTATVTLTVTQAQGYSLSAGAASVQQGSTGTSIVNFTRTGGFAGAVTLAATNLPTGVTASFSPNNTTGNSSTLTFTATGSAAAGSYTATVTGTATGLANVTTTVSLTVTSSGGGSGNINWTFCDTEDFPLWFAVQQGSGAWTRITPTGTTTRVYSFNMSGNGGVAYAQSISSGGVGVIVQYLSQDEITYGGTAECVTNPAKKTLTGTVAGLSAGQSATVMVGNGSGSASTNGAVSVSNVPFGTTDLFATRSAFNLTTLSFAPDRAIIRRNVNFASAITPTLDFAGGDSFALTSAPYTIANANGEPLQITTGFLTSNGTAGNFVSALNSTTNPATVYGVPSAQTQNGDLHQILAFAYTTSGTNTSSRGMTQYNRELSARTLTLGATLNLPTLTSLGSTPYVRYSATGTWQSDYPHSVGVGYTKAVTGSNSWTISVSRTYAGTGASSYSLVMPDFSGVAGFNTAWGMGSGTTNVAITASGVSSGFNTGTGTGIWSEGGFFRFASRTTTISP